MVKNLPAVQENSIDRGAGWATALGVTKSQI